jgi:hypothetical protein
MNEKGVRPALSGWSLLALLATAVASLLPGCTEAPRRAARSAPVVQRGEDPMVAKPNTSAPFDVGRVMRQVHFAFRPAEAGRFEGGHATHTLSVDRDGALSMTPVHHRRALPPLAARKACRLVTTSVKRGDSELARKKAQISVESSGALGVRRGDVLERLRNSAAGVEQSWSFSRRPSGSGDLVVRVAVNGLKYSGRTNHGLHFADPATGVGVRYGWATWVDAHGQRTALRGSYADGFIVMRVAGATLDRAAYPAVLDPTISAEFGMDKAAHGPPPGKQDKPAIAHGGGVFLVVWQDARGTKSDIVGTTVNASGVVQNPLGITVSKASGDQSAPAVAYDGTNFLVVWEDSRSSGWDIYGTRVSKTGTVVDAKAAAISTAGGNQNQPAVVFGTNDYLVVWQSKSGASWDIYGSRVNTSGVAQDSLGIHIGKAAGDELNPAVGFDGTNYLVAWQDKSSVTDWNIYCARLKTDGTLLDPTGKSISLDANDQQLPAIAFDGTNYLVVWQDDRNGAASTKLDIFGTRVSKSATVLDVAGIPISKYTTDQHDQMAPAVAFDGTNYLVTWHDNRQSTSTPATWDLYGARVSTSGAVVTTSGASAFAISSQHGNQQDAALAHGGSQYLVVWTDGRFEGNGLGSSSGINIYGARVSDAGSVQDAAGIPLSTDLNEQQAPAVAHDGTNYLVVWSDYRTKITATVDDSSWDIVGARIDAKGVLLDASGITISEAFNDQKDPAVVFGGSEYLVTWSDYRAVVGKNLATRWDIFAARVTTTGTVTDTAGIAVSKAANDQLYPAVAFNGAQYLVTWQDNRSGPNTDIYGARVSTAGSVQDASGITVSAAAYQQERPAVASDGSQFLVVWQDKSGGNTYGIVGARLSSTGALSPLINIASMTNNQMYPTVVSDKTTFVVAWQDKRNGTNWDIYGAIVTAAGAVPVPGGVAVTSVTGDQIAPSLVYDGYSFVAAWQAAGGSSWDIEGARLSISSNTLSPADKPPFAVTAADAVDQISVALATDGDGQTLAAYYRPDSTTIYGVDRVRAVLAVTSAKQGAVCQVDPDCQSGYCSDKVCCDTACGGGVSTDCQACSKVAGAAADGTCGPAAFATVCRPALGGCDLAESCDGTAITCPADLFVVDGSSCTNGSCAKGICVPTPDGGGSDADRGVSDATLEAGADLSDGPKSEGLSDAATDVDGPKTTEAGKDLGEAGAGDTMFDSAGAETGAGLEAGTKADSARSTYCLGPSCREPDGCTCRVSAGAGASNSGGAALLVLTLLLLLWRGRRRAKREEVRR